MPDIVFPLDPTKTFEDQKIVGHNRWHPDIPPVVTLKPGQSVRIECREWFDGAIVNDDSAEDILNAPLKTVHKLSGPFAVEGAKPGDLLIVDILDVGPLPESSGPLAGQGWGYTGIFAKTNGGGFLTDYFPHAHKAGWDLTGPTATSRPTPHLAF
ncbi:MAG: acetamidase/formamidase family protein, partial [Promicromonosporaceae bacterium]|nr:acetamidase/formamidase family protein [Promicromonosporaceae bacterium]